MTSSQSGPFNFRKIFVGKYLLAIIFLFILFSFGLFFLNFGRKPNMATVILDDHVFNAEIADTAKKRMTGLSGHKPLLSNQGMLFIFNRPGNYGFWMKDMDFPLDIIWLDSKMKITHIESNLSPETYPTIYYSNLPSKYVLEITAGLSRDYGFKVGDQVEFGRL